MLVFLLHSLALHAVVSVFVSSCLYSCVVWSYMHCVVLFRSVRPLLQPQAAKVFLSDDTIALTVKALDLNCQIDKYIVKDIASADKLQSSYSVENGIVTITITGLEAGANYTVQVYTVYDQSQERPIGKPVTFLISSQDKVRNEIMYS